MKKQRNIISNYLQKRRLHRYWAVFVLLLSAIVAGGVYINLTEPVNTMTVICGQEEHTHSSSCYTSTLTCTNTDEDHVHGDGCYTEQLTCGKSEHVHVDACYSTSETKDSGADVVASNEEAPAEETAPPQDDNSAPEAVSDAVAASGENEETEVVSNESGSNEETGEAPDAVALQLAGLTPVPALGKSGQPVSFSFSVENAESLSYNIVKGDVEVGAGKLDVDARSFTWTPDAAGQYTLVLTAVGTDWVEKTARCDFETVDAEAMSVRIGTERRSCFAGDTVHFDVSSEGGLAPVALNVRVLQGDKVLYEGAAAETGIDVTTSTSDDVTLLAIEVTATDALGDTASASAQIPCAVKKVETSADWKKSVSAAKLGEEWPDNLIAIAKTQLGYTESAVNFIIDEAGETHAWTRYGEFMGKPYEEWSAMYVSFCLNYANIPESYFPREANVARLASALKSSDLYASSTEPKAGDLVFFDQDRDGSIDHVGIIASVQGSTLYTYEGAWEKAVASRTHQLGEGRIVGFGLLNRAYEKYLAKQTVSFAYSGEGFTASATSSGLARLPKNAQLVVKEASTTDTYNEAIVAALGESPEALAASRVFAVNFTADGETVQAQDAVTVEIQFEEAIALSDGAAVKGFRVMGDVVEAYDVKLDTADGMLNALSFKAEPYVSYGAAILTSAAAEEDKVGSEDATEGIENEGDVETDLEKPDEDAVVEYSAEISLSEAEVPFSLLGLLTEANADAVLTDDLHLEYDTELLSIDEDDADYLVTPVASFERTVLTAEMAGVRYALTLDLTGMGEPEDTGVLKGVHSVNVANADYTLNIAVPANAELPAGANFVASAVTENAEAYIAKALEAVAGDADTADYQVLALFDLTIYDENNQVISPVRGSALQVGVNLGDALASDANVSVVHFPGTGPQPAAEPTLDTKSAEGLRSGGKKLMGAKNTLQAVDTAPTLTVETLNASNTNGVVTFSAGSFSVYAVIGDVHPSSRLTVNFYGKDTSEPLATMYVKNDDDLEHVNMILFDPGAGALDDGEIFRGWVIGDIAHKGETATMPEYTVEMASTEDALKTIEDVREWAAAFDADSENHIIEGDVVNIRAAIYKSYVVTFNDPYGITQNADSILVMPSQTGAYHYTLSHSYTPVKDTLRFDGWKPSDETVGNITAATQHAEGVLYQKDDEIDITGNVDFTAQETLGHYVVYHENGKGATYVAPDFVVAGDDTVEPTIEMQRNGYDFNGWYTGVTGEAVNGYQQVTGEEYQFGENLDDIGEEKLHLYADWTPKGTAPYTVIFWMQNGDRTDYDLVDSYVGNGRVGTNIPYTFRNNGDEDYTTVGGTDYHYTGFCVKQPEQQVTITPEGDAVLNLYYDRILYNVRFYLYRRNGNGANDFQFAQNSNNGQNIWGIASWYNGTSFANMPTTTYPGGIQSQSGVGGNNITGYYITLSAYYGDDISGKWPTYDQIGSGRSGNSTYYPVSYIMMNGTGLKPNPSNQGDSTLKGVYNYLNENILGATNDANGNFLIVRFNSYNNWTYHLYFEVYDGQDLTGKTTRTVNGKTYYLAEDFTSRSSNTIPGSQNPPQYAGFQVVKQNASRPYYDQVYIDGVLDGQPQQNSVSEHNAELNYYYDRLLYPINYMDGTYFDGNGNIIQNRQQELLHTSDDIDYEADIPDEDKAYTPNLPAGESGYVFERWYADAACNTPYTFTTMPIGGITVYAKWVQTEYRVFLKPNLPEDITSSEEAWGSNQQLSFRRPYNTTVSLPKGNANLEKYEFVGWYTTPDFQPSSIFTEDYRLTESLAALQDYDKTVDMTDVLDFRTGEPVDPDAAYNTDQQGNRWWITKKLVLYAKWREVLPGAPGIQVVYDAGELGEEGSAPVDSAWYADRAISTAQAGSQPADPTVYQFECWMVQTWNGTEFVDTGIEVYPGDTFEVLKANAREEDIPVEEQENGITKKYTVQLRAMYKPVEDPTPTHIDWYKNYEENGSHTAFHQDKKLQINQPVGIQPAPTRVGYSFIGWARVKETVSHSHTPEGATVPVADVLALGPNQVYIKWQGGQFWAQDEDNGNAWVPVTEVAADEVTPYDDMYAVWVKDYPITVEKEWDNTEGFTEYIPDTVTVEVLRNGASFTPNKVTIDIRKNQDGTSWSGTSAPSMFPAFDANGNEIHYSIKEPELDGWELSSTVYGGGKEYVNQDNFGTPVTLTNTRVNGSITLSKTISGLPDALVSELNNVQFYVKGPKQQNNTYKTTYGPYKLSDFTLTDGTYTLSPDDLKFVEPGEYIYYEGNANLLTDWGYELKALPGTTEANPVPITLSKGGSTASGSITNEYERVLGDLYIYKTVEGNPSGKFPYTVKIQNSKGWWLKGAGTSEDKYDLTNVDSEAGVYRITESGMLVLNDIPIGTYTVIEQGTEENGSAWIEYYDLVVTYTTNPVVVPKDTGDQFGRIDITNTYTRHVGNLSVSKATVPNTISKNDFKFTVQNSETKYLYWDATTEKYGFQENPYEFTITSNGAAVSFLNIPVDTYTVSEVIDGTVPGDKANVQVDGYRYDTTTYTANGVAQVVKDTTTPVTITNNYTKLVDVTVTKTLVDITGETGPKTFNFTATLTEGGTDISADYLGTIEQGKTGFAFTLAPSTKDTDPVYTFTGIPVGAVLTVTETADSDYTTTVSVAGAEARPATAGELTVADSGNNTIAFTNTRITQALNFKKLDSADQNKVLPDATFTMLVGATTYHLTSTSDTFIPEEVTTGTFILPIGTYTLVETNPPAGYLAPSEDLNIVVESTGVRYGSNKTAEPDANGVYTVLVYNSSGVSLPSTGSTGALPYTLSGLALMALAAVIAARKLRRY